MTLLDANASSRPIEGPEFATFNYADYLTRQGVYSLIDRPQVKVLAHDQGSSILSIIYGFRNRAYVVIQQILPEPQAARQHQGSPEVKA